MARKQGSTQIEDNQYLAKKIAEEEKWIYENLNCPKAIFLTIITLGFYRMDKTMDYTRRVGLI
jgi:hypothetical protein